MFAGNPRSVSECHLESVKVTEKPFLSPSMETNVKQLGLNRPLGRTCWEGRMSGAIGSDVGRARGEMKTWQERAGEGCWGPLAFAFLMGDRVPILLRQTTSSNDISRAELRPLEGGTRDGGISRGGRGYLTQTLELRKSGGCTRLLGHIVTRG